MPLIILVADDEPVIRLLISDYLEMSGYSVVTAEDGKQALEMIEVYQPHLVVTDIAMPQMDGYELVRQVRQQPALRLLPVIFLTVRTETQARIQGYQLGCDLYLPKPFDLDELGAGIRNLLERSQLIQSEWRLRNQAQSLASSNVSARKQAIVLTAREQQVLELLAQGLSNAQIGAHLHLSSRTIEKHVSSLLQKSQTSNRVELVRFSMEQHLIE
ncbi:MAG TPA: response regulator transcription factor [Candidatus Caenarcaniphilales bacterium]